MTTRDRKPEADAEEGGFVGRWSRLKRERRAEPPEAEDAAALAEPDAEAAPAPDERSDEEILEELGLPDPDGLSKGDDFRAFMTKAVPDRIRRRALRRLWLSDPVLANLDEMVDYGDDFTDAAMVVENLQSAYQAGRGYLKRIAEGAEADAAEGSAVADPAVSEAPAAEPSDAPADTPSEAESPDPDRLAEGPAPEAEAPRDAARAVPEGDRTDREDRRDWTPRSRMQFREAPAGVIRKT